MKGRPTGMLLLMLAGWLDPTEDWVRCPLDGDCIDLPAPDGYNHGMGLFCPPQSTGPA